MTVTSDDDAVLQMLAGASFGPESSLTLPSGKTLDADEAQALTSAYAPTALRPAVPADPTAAEVLELAKTAFELATRTRADKIITRDDADRVAVTPTGPWRVLRQSSHLPDQAVCAHRFGWVAEWCARRRTRGSESGVFHSARKVERRAES